jgi:putative Mn2+ efflux pump MntP
MIDFNFNFIINSSMLGVGLAMDAFSVSLANGLSEPCMGRRRQSAIAGVYAGFQFAMPMIGWICVHTIAQIFTGFQKFIPWIALVLLLYIGGKMLIEGIKNKDECPVCKKLSTSTLIIQGIATSIDALSVGFTIADYQVSIAVVTFIICVGGLVIGRKFGTKLAGKASILGGVILIAIGFKIFFGV